MIYESMLGLDPVEVEVLEIDEVKGTARIIIPITADTLANVFRREAGEPEIEHVTRTVPRATLRPLPS